MIIEKITNRLLYLNGTLTPAGVSASGFFDQTTTPENAVEIATPGELPEMVTEGQSTFSEGVWTHPAPVLDAYVTKKKLQITQLMAAKQDGGVIFNGLPISTDPGAVADLSGMKAKGGGAVKVVPRGGKGSRASLSGAQFDALFAAVANYRKAVMENAHDLIGTLEAAPDPSTVDINAGWPTNIY